MHRLNIFSVLLLLSACRSDPSQPGVTLSPNSPSTLDNIVAGVDNCDDCQFRWFKDGVRVEGIDGDTVTADLTAKGEEWSVLATAVQEDGSEGLPGEAKTTVVNTLPEITAFSVSPDEVFTADVMVTSAEATDADGDELVVSYAWTVDGEPAGEDSDSLDGLEFFDKGQEVAVTVTVSDGEDETSETSSPIEVGNTAPSSAGIELEWLTCAALEFDGESAVVVDASETLEYGDAFTLEGWFRWDDIDTGFSDFEQLFSQGWDSTSGKIVANLSLDHSGSACGESGMDLRLTWASAGNSNCLAMPGLTPETWQHVAVVYDQGEMRGFVDGVLQNSVSVSNTPYLGEGTTLGIGAIDYEQGGTPSKGFGGSIRDFRVAAVPRYIADFSPEEFLTADSDTSMLLILGEGSGSFVADSSGNENHGSTVGTQWSTECPEGQEEGFHCRVVGESDDLDEDPVTYGFEWSVNGDAFADAETLDNEGDFIPLELLIDQDVWECVVIPTDGEDEADSMAASLMVEFSNLVTNGLIADYPFDDGSGDTLSDISGNGNDGQLGIDSGSSYNPTWSSGYLGFDNSCATIPVDPTALGSWSFQMLYRAPSQSGQIRLGGVKADSRTRWQWTPEGTSLRVAYSTGSNDGNTQTTNMTASQIHDNQWHVLTYVEDDSGAVKLYVDGVLEDQATLHSIPNFSTLNAFTLASAECSGQAHDPMEVDFAYMLVYDRDLSASEVSENQDFLDSVLEERGLDVPPAYTVVHTGGDGDGFRYGHPAFGDVSGSYEVVAGVGSEEACAVLCANESDFTCAGFMYKSNGTHNTDSPGSWLDEACTLLEVLEADNPTSVNSLTSASMD